MTRPTQGKGSINRRDFLKLAGAATGLLFLESCSPSSGTSTPMTAPTATARPGGTLRVAFPGVPSKLYPALGLAQEDYGVTIGVYDNLVRLDHNLALQPELAESWTKSDDLKTWTFKLRQGVKFHHGTPFTADDVVYTFERILDEGFGSSFRSVLSSVERVEKVSDYVVSFHMKTPNADLDTILGSPMAGIVPHDRKPEQLLEKPSGTGPFKLAEYAPGEHTKLVRNEEYWQKGLPYLDEVRQFYMPETATQVASLTGGTIDLLWQLSFENIAVVEGNPDVRIGEVRSGAYLPIVMKTTVEPFNDNRVRQALKYCVDRAGIRQVIASGHGDLGNDQPIPPVSPFWGNVPIRERNIEKAKALLAEAGHADGLNLTLYASPIRPGMVEQAVSFQEMVKPAGINVKVERVPADVYWNDYWMKTPLFTSSWNLRTNADETLSIAYHSKAKWNESDWKSEEMDLLIDTARGEKDQEKRKELYTQAQKLLSEEGGVVVAVFRPVVVAMRKNVQGFQPHPSSWMFYKTTWLSETA